MKKIISLLILGLMLLPFAAQAEDNDYIGITNWCNTGVKGTITVVEWNKTAKFSVPKMSKKKVKIKRPDNPAPKHLNKTTTNISFRQPRQNIEAISAVPGDDILSAYCDNNPHKSNKCKCIGKRESLPTQY